MAVYSRCWGDRRGVDEDIGWWGVQEREFMQEEKLSEVYWVWDIVNMKGTVEVVETW